MADTLFAYNRICMPYALPLDSWGLRLYSRQLDRAQEPSLKNRTRKLPDAQVFGPMRERLGLRFSFAGTAFLNRYSDILDPVDLTPGRVLALSFLHEHSGCEQTALARGLEINEASAMSMINKLESLRMVERKAGHNKRSNALHLTARGQVAFNKALELEQALTARLLGWMGEGQLATFMATLDEVKRRASELSPAEISLPEPQKRIRRPARARRA
jgi:DNA-binding MarR family transcriptional regulator